MEAKWISEFKKIKEGSQIEKKMQYNSSQMTCSYWQKILKIPQKSVRTNK